MAAILVGSHSGNYFELKHNINTFDEEYKQHTIRIDDRTIILYKVFCNITEIIDVNSDLGQYTL